MSRLSKLINSRASNIIPRGIELATVVSPPPALKIRIDNMDINLEGDDLIVCQHLLDYDITYDTSPAVSGGSMSPNGTGPHTHAIQSLVISGQKAAIKTRLQVGDRVAVQALPGEQQYLVIDKVVEMDA